MTHPRPHAPARPHAYGVVGAGRVGSVVAARLHAAGRPVVGISARSQASLLRARTLVPEVPVRPAADVAADCDVLVLAVPDDALVAVCEELSTVLRPGQVVVHTSGRHGLDALSAATRVGAQWGSPPPTPSERWPRTSRRSWVARPCGSTTPTACATTPR